ncbi:phosphonate ABC transporter, permease protein PhnE [Roseibacterium beibuensis]|uniref:phosphonate ABC transporter, permease protein PhnE n=1 Tax=[Roseibacterium] beibuensis TaxID=1193142 RepID=UPI00217F0C30|nr:phosphonate ABC transporter, permease protein PhnE [Roseibacterium beibuensis]MCS6624749.1 phosphonate ABC transporter, permease protein PhnE [Roseibacterium beibuensis]
MTRLPTLLAAVLAFAVVLCGLAPAGVASAQAERPEKIVFTVLSAEGQASSGPLWQPLLDDLERELGLPVEPIFGSNYSVLVEAMRANQAQIGWFSALPAVQAIDRSNGEVIARTVDVEGKDSYVSTIIVKKGSGITIEDVARCGKQYTFGIGDAQSTSGTLAPMTYFFGPRGIDPTQCFSTVRSANHQANAFSVANGQVDIATSNSVNTVFLRRQNPQIADQIEEIWQSPPIPESGIVIRSDLPPDLKARIKRFFITYGQGFGPNAERQRQVMEGLNYSQFRAADNSYLDPIREMKADQARREGRPPEVAPPASAGTLIGRWWPFALIGALALVAIALNAMPGRAPLASDPAKVPEPPKKSMAAWSLDLLLWGGFAIMLLAAFNKVDLPNILNLFSNSENMRNYGRDFLNPDFSNWRALVGLMWLTVQIALWGTFLAVFLAVPLSLMASRNLSPPWLVWPVRRVMDLMRSVPDLVVATLFIVAVGLGPLAGVLAIGLNTAGVLAKLFSEAVESIDKGPIEGVKATGAGRLHEIMWGVIPQVAPLWTSFALYRFESNSRAATVLGLIGAGGIGQALFESLQAFEYREVSLIAIIIVVAVTLIDMLSQAMRKRLL